MTCLAQITSDDVLDSAYEWLCRRRRNYSANSEIERGFDLLGYHFSPAGLDIAKQTITNYH